MRNHRSWGRQPCMNFVVVFFFDDWKSASIIDRENKISKSESNWTHQSFREIDSKSFNSNWWDFQTIEENKITFEMFLPIGFSSKDESMSYWKAWNHRLDKKKFSFDSLETKKIDRLIFKRKTSEKEMLGNFIFIVFRSVNWRENASIKWFLKETRF